jgi:hypothetical protein
MKLSMRLGLHDSNFQIYRFSSVLVLFFSLSFNHPQAKAKTTRNPPEDLSFPMYQKPRVQTWFDIQLSDPPPKNPHIKKFFLFNNQKTTTKKKKKKKKKKQTDYWKEVLRLTHSLRSYLYQ